MKIDKVEYVSKQNMIKIGFGFLFVIGIFLLVESFYKYFDIKHPEYKENIFNLASIYVSTVFEEKDRYNIPAELKKEDFEFVYEESKYSKKINLLDRSFTEKGIFVYKSKITNNAIEIEWHSNKSKYVDKVEVKIYF
ncbi:MAG: hypothetical protein SPI86_07695 [Treponemataceae bacterium]|nr:hypothetical protein [Spirochaetales bacterium]MDY6031628.1 hypothetical protein [Treponemataceae bacterium]